jgi:hypothetical protein
MTEERSTHKLEGINLAFTSGLDAESTSIILDEANWFVVAAKLALVQSLTKAPGYKNSWCKRGDHGIFFTIARKWDRLESIFTSGKDIWKGFGEAVEETVLDLAVYSMKWLGYILAKHPDRYDKLVERLYKEVVDVQDKIEIFDTETNQAALHGSRELEHD